MSDCVAGPFPQEKLLDLYRIAIDEYRFEVRLGWDRTTYFLILNSAILTAAATLLKLDGPPLLYGFVAVLFLFGCGTSSVGSMSITRSHEYYRRTVVKKALIEDEMGLHNALPSRHTSLNLAIGTTRGHSELVEILADPDAWVNRKHRRTAITFWLRWMLRGMAVVDAVGCLVAVGLMIQKLLGVPLDNIQL